MMTVAPGNLSLQPSCGLHGKWRASGAVLFFFCADVTKLKGISFSKLVFSPHDFLVVVFFLRENLSSCKDKCCSLIINSEALSILNLCIKHFHSKMMLFDGLT